MFRLHLQKYWLVFKLHWQNVLTYPISFAMWRLRQILGTLTALTLWTVIFAGQQNLFGYTQTSMVSYIFLTALLQSVILSTFLNGLASDIYTGQISNLFVKPIRPFWVWITQEIADKSMNFSFVVAETAILFAIFKPVLVFPALPTMLLFLLAAFLGAVILFFIMLLFGSIGFWSQETWGIRFLFYMFVELTAGKIYPLNIMPEWIQHILFLTPFPLLSYVQTQIFLGNMNPTQTLQTFLLMGAWILGLGLFFKYIWQKGLKSYGAMGR